MGPHTPRVKHPVRVVLDTNVLVSALIFGGPRWQSLRAAWQTGAVVPLVGRETAAELLQVLAYRKFRLAAAEREALLADYLPYSEVIKVPKELPELPEVRDADDVKFLVLAIAGKADVLVSGDADLLSLRAEWTRIPIMAPMAFLDWLAVQGS